MVKAQATPRRRRTLLAALLLLALLLPGGATQAAGEGGTIVWETVTSPALQGNLLGDPDTRTYGVYLPPGYEGGAKRYPVVYLLHGFGGNARSLAVPAAAIDDMLRQAGAPDMMLVFVDGSNCYGGSFYGRSPTIGNYEEYIARDLVQHIDSKYRTLARPESRGITGFSMGGYGALHLALLYPDVFAVVVAQAGLYDWRARTDATYMSGVSDVKTMEELGRTRNVTHMVFALAALGAANAERPPFYLDAPYRFSEGRAQPEPDTAAKIAARDGLHDVERNGARARRLRAMKLVHGAADSMVPVSQARALDQELTALGVKHAYEEHGGGHVFLLEKSLAFMAQNLAPAETHTIGEGWPAPVVDFLQLVASILSRLRLDAAP